MGVLIDKPELFYLFKFISTDVAPPGYHGYRSARSTGLAPALAVQTKHVAVPLYCF